MTATEHVLDIPGWRPATDNQLGRGLTHKIRMKKEDKEAVAIAALKAGVPRATGKRRVTVHLTLGPKDNDVDGLNLCKSLMDALVACGMLVGDNLRWVEVNTALWTTRKGERRGTVIVLTDLE